MAKDEKTMQIDNINSKILLKQAMIEQLKSEISILQNELFLIKWVKISWNELEEWLKENRPENDYKKNPMVSNGSSTNYCRLNKEGKLQIGAWEHTDGFRQGRDLFIMYNFQSYYHNRR